MPNIRIYALNQKPRKTSFFVDLCYFIIRLYTCELSGSRATHGKNECPSLPWVYWEPTWFASPQRSWQLVAATVWNMYILASATICGPNWHWASLCARRKNRLQSVRIERLKVGSNCAQNTIHTCDTCYVSGSWLVQLVSVYAALTF